MGCFPSGGPFCNQAKRSQCSAKSKPHALDRLSRLRGEGREGRGGRGERGERGEGRESGEGERGEGGGEGGGGGEGRGGLEGEVSRVGCFFCLLYLCDVCVTCPHSGSWILSGFVNLPLHFGADNAKTQEKSPCVRLFWRCLAAFNPRMPSPRPRRYRLPHAFNDLQRSHAVGASQLCPTIAGWQRTLVT